MLNVWVGSLPKVGRDCSMGKRRESRYSEMFSGGQLQAETMGLLGVLILCILGRR